MESCLVGEDLWEVVGGDDVNHLENTPKNIDNLKKWRIVNAKAESILKRSISHGYLSISLAVSRLVRFGLTSMGCSIKRMWLDCNYWRMS
jgi:hypothetical protein